MIEDQELIDLMQAIAQKSLSVIAYLRTHPSFLPELINQYIDLTEHVQHAVQSILKKPAVLLEMHMEYCKDLLDLAQTQFQHWLEGRSMPIDDTRFSSDEWVQNPFFNLLSQQYLLANKHTNTLLKKIAHEDPKKNKSLHFFTKQYLDALSPANYLHSNPQILAETLQSNGKNLLRGLHNLLSDVELDSPQIAIKLKHSKAFKVGDNLATTPGKVVFRNELMELIQYLPQKDKVKSTPLLIIPPWINKYYILDLSSHNSLVKWLVQQGITLFIISWINPDSNHAHKSFYHYMKEGPQEAIALIQKQMGVRKVNALGFCIGGTLLASLLAYNKALKDNSIRSATFLATLIDFSEPGDIAVFIDQGQIKKIEQTMQAKGYLPGKSIAQSFNLLRANDLIWSYFIKSYLLGKSPIPFDILFWNSDSTNMPATMHSQYLRWMYLSNKLVKPGAIRLNKIPLDIRQINTPTFFVSAQKDHIAPWQTTYLGYQLMKGPKRFVLSGSGHIAGIVNPPSAQKYGYRTNPSTTQNASEWLEQAVEHPGSWWPEWLKWLKSHSGKLIPAVDPNNLPLAPLIDAPGSYVFK